MGVEPSRRLVANSAPDAAITRPVAIATAATATAYVVDYHMVPGGLTPGFDAHLSNRSLAGAYIAPAVGLGGKAVNFPFPRYEPLARDFATSPVAG